MTDIERAGLAVMRVLAENQSLREENERLRMLLTVKPPEDQPVTVLHAEEEKSDG
jgi:hypothetical protein